MGVIRARFQPHHGIPNRAVVEEQRVGYLAHRALATDPAGKEEP
jgi:hypothetical protein